MKIKNNVKNGIIISFFIIIITFFFIPELLAILQINQRLNNISILIENYGKQKIELKQKLLENKNINEKLKNEKEKNLKELKELAVVYGIYENSLYEEQSENKINERTVNLMESLINIYEKNFNITREIIKNLTNFFKSHSLNDYINNKLNILMVSTIIKNESDIEFIYNKILPSFYLNNTNNNNYILSPPCFKTSFDSNEPSIFHKKCDNVGDTIIVIKTNKTRFGGITEFSWSQKNVKDEKVFDTRTLLFNLNNKKIFKYNKNHNTNKHIAPISGDNYCFAIFGYKDIYLDYLPKDSCSDFPSQFLKNENTSNYFNDLLDEKSYNNNKIINFEYEEIEVYPISIITNN